MHDASRTQEIIAGFVLEGRLAWLCTVSLSLIAFTCHFSVILLLCEDLHQLLLGSIECQPNIAFVMKAVVCSSSSTAQQGRQATTLMA